MLNAEPIEKHIFRNSEEYFSEKLHSFHDNFVDCFLLIGIDEPNKAWDEIKMTKNPLFSGLYYKRIVGGIMETPPLINIRSIINGEISAACDIFYLNNLEDIDNFYMTQRVMNWKNSALTSHQVWQIDSIDLFALNDHWL